MRFALAALCLLAAAPAFAQSASVAPPPADPCVPPALPQRFSLPAEDIAYLHKQVNAYSVCVSQYIAARQTAGQDYANRARAEIDAGNAAAKDANAYIATVKDFESQHRDKGGAPAGGN
ncbi:MAG: hypothetical protein WDN01_22710 [Rhizomicrobium sp.]